MVMMPVGMVEVSTCSLADLITTNMTPNADGTVYTSANGVKVKKGDELGSFRFGGSTHCLIFSPNTKLKFYQEALPTEGTYFVPLNSAIAEVVKHVVTE
jgi:phosphatidylserine decarboxylase